MSGFSIAVTALYVVGALFFTIAPIVACGLGMAAVAKQWKSGTDASRERRASLARLGFEAVGDFQTRGMIGGLNVTLEERPVVTQAVELGGDERAVFAIGSPFSRTRHITRLNAPMPKRLAATITLSHTGSMRGPRPLAGSRVVPGHTHPLADASHSVHATDLRWAQGHLAQLAARGGIADLETDGWRVSYDEEQAYMERDGQRLPMAELERGAGRLRVLLGRLAET